MLSQIENILSQFRNCFSRQATYDYFCIVVLSFLIVEDPTGVTAIVRTLFLLPVVYERLIHFYKSKAYRLQDIILKWLQLLEDSPYSLEFEGRNVLIGDHTKISKEARRMPAVKQLHQDSENLKKAPTIMGHHFGSLGILLGSLSKPQCAPFSSRIHEGTEQVLEWLGLPVLGRAERLVADAIKCVQSLKKSSYILFDRDFFSQKAIKRAIDYNQDHKQRLDIIGRCKNNVVSKRKLTREELEANRKEHKRGRPRKYAPPIYLKNLFKECADQFQKVTLPDGYRIKYYSTFLEWNDMLLLFVLTIDSSGRKSIFYSTDLELSPVKVVILYRLRFKIECAFNNMKHILNGFSYKFWVKDFEKLTNFNWKDRLERAPETQRQRIINCIDRIERMVNFSGIALGIMEIIAIEAGSEYGKEVSELLFQRTYSKDNSLSIWQVKKLIQLFFKFSPEEEADNSLIKLIKRVQSKENLGSLFNFRL